MITLTCLGNDAAERLIDGLINHTIVHRWHSDRSEPHRYSDTCQNTTHFSERRQATEPASVTPTNVASFRRPTTRGGG